MSERSKLLPPPADILTGIKFALSLRRVFRRPLTPDQALGVLRRRLERREDDFLDTARRAIYGNPLSPYQELLRRAGCEFEDLERLVRRAGLEGALLELFRQGVYLTVDEFKGRQPAVRGSLALNVSRAHLANPDSVVHVMVQSSGSRGPRRAAPFDLAFIKEAAVDRILVQSAQGAMDRPRAIWYVPGGAPLYVMTIWGAAGIKPERWFSQVEAKAGGLDPRYGWSERAMRLGARLAGVRLPASEFAPVDAPFSIIQWMRRCLDGGSFPHLSTFASSAAGLCQAAREKGLDLRGARFELTGEPVTETVQAVLRAAGAEALTVYGSMETGTIAFACLRPEVSDDSHLLTDCYSLIQPGGGNSPGVLPATALLITSLRPSSPLVFLNVSMGDQADLAPSTCGCPLEGFGWTTRLRNIRSFEKLTAFGMTFFDTDLIPILEKEMPARFGGGPMDYQILERQGPDGRTRMSLIIHPSVGPVDEGRAAETLLELIGAGGGAKRVMELQWRLAGVLQVERRPPVQTSSGKILHLHQVRE